MKKSFLQFAKVIPLVLLCFIISCQQQVKEATAEEELKEIARRVIEEAWNQGKMDVLDEQYATDYVYHRTPFPDIVGLEAFKQYITDNRSSYSDLHITIEEMIVEGNVVAMRGTYSGTQTGASPTLGIPATGKQITFKWCAVSHRVNGKTVEDWNYVDWLGFMKQLGFTIAPPQPPEKE